MQSLHLEPGVVLFWGVMSNLATGGHHGSLFSSSVLSCVKNPSRMGCSRAFSLLSPCLLLYSSTSLTQPCLYSLCSSRTSSDSVICSLSISQSSVFLNDRCRVTFKVLFLLSNQELNNRHRLSQTNTHIYKLFWGCMFGIWDSVDERFLALILSER